MDFYTNNHVCYEIDVKNERDSDPTKKKKLVLSADRPKDLVVI